MKFEAGAHRIPQASPAGMNMSSTQTVDKRERLILEVVIIIVALGLTCLLWRMQAYKMVILNLFFLPVVLSGFFLGRYTAGIMALFCFMSASIVIALNLSTVEVYASTTTTALAITAWGAVLGLTSLLIGTLSDERRSQMNELHDAYVGVVEVLSRYLQGAHPQLKDRAVRIAELCQRVAQEMRLSAKEIDDIRVAALLYDVGNIEITTTVIRKAVGALSHDTEGHFEQTIQGMDLVLSLGSVLNGAVPLLLNQEHDLTAGPPASGTDTISKAPIGARIIRAVRAYDNLCHRQSLQTPQSDCDPFDILEKDPALDPRVLLALHYVTSRPHEEMASLTSAAL